MKTFCAVSLLLLLALALLAGCHNTGRQIRKTVDSTHDIFLEGSN
jgi:predicted small secreted protein